MVGAIVITIKQKIKDSFFCFVFAIPGPVSALYINDIYPLIVYSIPNPASRYSPSQRDMLASRIPSLLPGRRSKTMVLDIFFFMAGGLGHKKIKDFFMAVFHYFFFF